MTVKSETYQRSQKNKLVFINYKIYSVYIIEPWNDLTQSFTTVGYMNTGGLSRMIKPLQENDQWVVFLVKVLDVHWSIQTQRPIIRKINWQTSLLSKSKKR